VILFFSTVCAVVCCTTAVLFHRETRGQDLSDHASSSFSSSRDFRDRDSFAGSILRVELADTPMTSRAATPAGTPSTVG